jgi:hypothetical protein
VVEAARALAAPKWSRWAGAVVVLVATLSLMVGGYLASDFAEGAIRDQGLLVADSERTLINDAAQAADSAHNDTNSADKAHAADIAREKLYDAIGRAVANPPGKPDVTNGKATAGGGAGKSASTCWTPGLETAFWITWPSILLLMLAAGLAFRGNLLGVLIDDRGRMSLSRFQAVVWTIVTLAGYWTISFWNIGIGTSGAIALPAMQPQLWTLLGVVTVSPLASSVIVSVRRPHVILMARARSQAIIASWPPAGGRPAAG